jgi:hypothetical protein
MTPLFTICRCSGEALLESVDTPAHSAAYRLRWKAVP